MCRSEDGTIEMQFKRLLVLFEDILKESEDYHIIKFPELGYVAILGEYLPEKDSETVISRLSFHKYFTSPSEMTDSLMENFRWQWYMKNNPPICSDDYKSISEMDDELSEEKYPDYFQILRYYTSEVRKIIGDTCNERK